MGYDVGIFDSGLGGLTVYKKLKAALPELKFAYLADILRCPYGTQSQEMIQHICQSNMQFFSKIQAKMIVIACHTASTNAYDLLKVQTDKKIIPLHLATGQYLLTLPLNSSLLILGTPSTIKNGYYQKLVKMNRPDMAVEALGCPILVEYIQNQVEDQSLLKDILNRYKIGFNHFDYVLLACTHFPIIYDAIASQFSHRSNIIDPAELIVQSFPYSKHLIKNQFQKDDFFITGNSSIFDICASKILNYPINSQCVDLEDCVKI